MWGNQVKNDGQISDNDSPEIYKEYLNKKNLCLFQSNIVVTR